MPIPVIATESTDVANKAESNAPDSILLSVGEQPPVEKQVAEQEEEQVPAPVFEVAVAPASPPQRSFSQSPPEPQTSTETVTRSDATGQSNHEDGAITFADWVAGFGAGNAPPTQAETTTITITSTRKNIFRQVRTVNYGTIYSDEAKTMPIGQRILARADTEDEFKDADGFLIYEESGVNILEDDTTETLADNPRVAYDAGAHFVTTVEVELTDENGDTVLDGQNNPIMVVRRVEYTEEQLKYFQQHGSFTLADKQTNLPDLNPRTRTKVAGVKNEFLQGGAGGRLDETVCDLCISYSTNSKGKLLNGKGKLLNGDGVFTEGGEARIIISGQVSNRGSLNLATATFGGQKLGGDAADGVAFFRGFDDVPITNDTENGYDHTSAGLAHNYAGLYSSTDLGAPVSGTSTASWNGRIRTLGWFDFDMDFTLRVTFGNDNTGTLNVAELRNSKNRKQFLQITNATYDANGVVSGTILIDEDDDNFGIGPQYGFLSGLIGAEGAVVAFLSSGSNKAETGTTGEKEDITDGSHRFGFAGGFVAHPTAIAAPANTEVTIEDWTGSFAKALPSGVKKHTLNQDDPLNQFLLRKDPAKRPSWKKKEGGS
ncbi:MAG: hypothetical protein K8953_09430, partial [Proteobacteria bacterium]|nr:hypothetical protein [Pseudomonadota bacterium]